MRWLSLTCILGSTLYGPKAYPLQILLGAWMLSLTVWQHWLWAKIFSTRFLHPILRQDLVRTVVAKTLLHQPERTSNGRDGETIFLDIRASSRLEMDRRFGSRNIP